MPFFCMRCTERNNDPTAHRAVCQGPCYCTGYLPPTSRGTLCISCGHGPSEACHVKTQGSWSPYRSGGDR